MVLDGALPQVLARSLVDHAEDERVLLHVTLPPQQMLRYLFGRMVLLRHARNFALTRLVHLVYILVRLVLVGK